MSGKNEDGVKLNYLSLEKISVENSRIYKIYGGLGANGN